MQENSRIWRCPGKWGVPNPAGSGPLSGFPQQGLVTGKSCLVSLKLTLFLRLGGFLGFLWTKIPGTVWELVWLLLELDWERDKTWSGFRLRFNILAQWVCCGV